ncbi:MAG: hypothetical protein HYU36_14495 [Planctomycetes bacterium]|nr:hypothetical protein [Planctomycetota bacterium]
MSLLLALIGWTPVACARWEEEARELPAWAQRGRIIFLRSDGQVPEPLSEMLSQWQPVMHLHGARSPGEWVVRRKALGIPTSLRLEAVMFFGDDRCVQKVYQTASHGWVEHTWYWQYNWWVRDPAFRQAALVRRDGRPMIEYWGNARTEREAGNPLSPLLLRMREEVSQAVLTLRQDAASTGNPLYPQFPYGSNRFGDVDFDDSRLGRGPSREYYPVFGHLSMLWYDNPTYWADCSEDSQKQWQEHFKKVFDMAIADPASHADELVRREWVRFWAEAYGRYLDRYYEFHQQNIQKTGVPETCTALDGRRHCTVGMNGSAVSSPWGAQELYLFHYHKGSDYPGMLVEYYPIFTAGKSAPLMKWAMASKRGRPTGNASSSYIHDGEALALNAAIVAGGVSDRTQAYLQFQYDLRGLLTNAMPGGTTGILYNIRSGLVTETLINGYELALQLDEIGCPFEVVIEEDLKPENTEALGQLQTLLVPGGEFDAEEIDGLKRYVEAGGHLVLIGDVLEEQAQALKVDPSEPPRGRFRPEIPMAGRWGSDGFSDGQMKSGKGLVTVREKQILTNAELREALEPRRKRSYQVLDPMAGGVFAHVLRQPRARNAILIGLVNYTGEAQKEIRLAVPEGIEPSAAVAVSPDGLAQVLTVRDSQVTIPELYSYAAVLLGDRAVLQQALEAVGPKMEALSRSRETLQKLQGGEIAKTAVRPEDVPGGMRLSRVRAGSFESGTFIALDSLAPRQVRPGQPVRVTMKILSTGTHYTGSAAFEYWRLQAVNMETVEGLETHPVGAVDAIKGAPVFLLDGEKLASAPSRGNELNGKVLVSEFILEKPGRYQLFVDYLFHNVFLQGDAGPAVSPAFPGDRPGAGAVFPGRALKKLYLRHKLPRQIVQVVP